MLLLDPWEVCKIALVRPQVREVCNSALIGPRQGIYQFQRPYWTPGKYITVPQYWTSGMYIVPLIGPGIYVTVPLLDFWEALTVPLLMLLGLLEVFNSTLIGPQRCI